MHVVQFQHAVDISRNLTIAANFSVYFTGRSTIRSTPHLYVSSLATWGSESELLKGWKKNFPGILSVKRTGKSGSELLMTLKGHTGWVRSVGFSSDGTRIMSGSDDKSVRVWDASTGALLITLNGHTHRVYSVAFSSDGTRIVSGSVDRSVRVWDVLHITQDKHRAFVNSVASLVSDVSMECPPVWDYTVHRRHWILSPEPEYWIIWLPYHKRLAQWVRSSPSDVIDPHAHLVISRESSAVIDFTNSKMGPNWATCYSSSLPS